MKTAITSPEVIYQLAFDHPGALVEYHDGAIFLTRRGVTLCAPIEDES